MELLSPQGWVGHNTGINTDGIDPYSALYVRVNTSRLRVAFPKGAAIWDIGNPSRIL